MAMNILWLFCGLFSQFGHLVGTYPTPTLIIREHPSVFILTQGEYGFELRWEWRG